MNNSTSSDFDAASGPRLRCGWPLEDTADDLDDLKYLDMIAYPILLLISTVGNCISIFVLRKEHPPTSKNVYLMTLACIDPIYMWAESLAYIYGLPGVRSDRFLSFHNRIVGVTIYLQETAAFAADWTVVAFSVDRLLAVKSPLFHRMISSAKRSTMVALGIVTTACLLVSARIIDYYWFYANDLGEDHPLPVRPPVLAGLRKFYAWTLPILPILTFLMVLTVNGLLMRVLVQKRKHRLLAFTASISTQTKSSSAASERSAFLMLAACVLLYLITQTPSVVLNIIETFDIACIRRVSQQFRYQTDPIKIFFAKLNYSLNFVLYLAINPAFRNAVVSNLRRVVDKDYRGYSAAHSASLTLQSYGSSRSHSYSSRHRSSAQPEEQTVPLQQPLYLGESPLL